ncbi:MAG TPA: tetratricopeptide repeat protein [Blastocatellia bacterium]|nr:tetratricopeptide repeat protein [Blastocatellia bacterium]
MNNTKYLVGLAGLAVGFLVSFLWVSSYNRNNATAAPSGATPGGMPAAGNSGDQQAMMAQVQQVISKAKQNPQDFQAQVDAAGVYFQSGKEAETVEYLKKAYALKPDEFKTNQQLLGALPLIATYYADQKQYDEADTWFRRSVEVEPNNTGLHIEMASSLIQRQPPQPDRAIQELQIALKANPKDAHALGHLVEAYAVKRDAAGADDALNRLRDADPGNQRLTALQGMVADLKAGKPVTLPKE